MGTRAGSHIRRRSYSCYHVTTSKAPGMGHALVAFSTHFQNRQLCVFPEESMKSASIDQPGSSYLPFSSAGEDSLQKLTPPALNPHCQVCGNLFKQAGILFEFHVLNAAVAIAGLTSVLLMVVSMLLMPAWICALLVVVSVLFLVHLMSLLPHTGLRVFGYVVLFALYLFIVCPYAVLSLGPFAVLGVGAIGVGIFYLSASSMKWLMTVDARLAELVSSSLQFSSTTELYPVECGERFKLAKRSDASIVLPHIRMTRRLWAAVLYFSVIKVVVGALGAAGVVLTVVQPAMALFSGGHALFFSNKLTFRESPIAYLVVIVFTWMVGAVGLVAVAKLSVQATSRVCGEWRLDDHQGNGEVQNDDDVEEVALPTPTQATNTTSFTELESAPTAPCAARTTTL